MMGRSPRVEGGLQSLASGQEGWKPQALFPAPGWRMWFYALGGRGVFPDFAPACSPAGSCCWRWVWAPITVPESSIFFSWQQVQELEAERWAGLSRPVCELKRPPHIPQTLLRVSLRVSSTSENKHFLLRGRDDGLMGAGRQGRRRQVVRDGVFRLLLEAACFWRPSHVRNRGELGQRRQVPSPQMWEVRSWNAATSMCHKQTPTSVGEAQARGRS